VEVSVDLRNSVESPVTSCFAGGSGFVEISRGRLGQNHRLVSCQRQQPLVKGEAVDVALISLRRDESDAVRRQVGGLAAPALRAPRSTPSPTQSSLASGRLVLTAAFVRARGGHSGESRTRTAFRTAKKCSDQHLLIESG